MNLKTLLSKSGVSAAVSADPDIRGLSYDSRSAKSGDLFFAMKGVHADAHDFLDQVKKQGAVAAVVEREVKIDLPTVKVPSTLSAMSKISNIFFDFPSQQIPVIGITGTNGKTTATYLIEAIFQKFGKMCGVLGTVNYRLGSDIRPAPNTTPMSLDVQSFIAEARQKKAAAVAMEVSSHALELKRVDDIQFKVGVFTNLTQDHLDFHKTMEAYFEAKKKLFFRPETVKAVINVDDEYGRRLAAETKDPLTFGSDNDARVRATHIKSSLSGNYFDLTLPSGKTYKISNNLLGLHNVSNCLAAAGALLAYGMKEEDIVAGLNQKLEVPGRLERVEVGQDFVVVVDYAHTHDAMAQVLTTLRNTGPKKLFCVFGAGGDRDKTKRPKMGKVAVELSDKAFVTSDNPRSEDPAMILRDIEAGIKSTGKQNYVMIPDRKEAIRTAIKEAHSGDIILIAGKGHETYQIVGNVKHHFSDTETAKEILTR